MFPCCMQSYSEIIKHQAGNHINLTVNRIPVALARGDNDKLTALPGRFRAVSLRP